MRVLVLNPGSSSLKSSVRETDRIPVPPDGGDLGPSGGSQVAAANAGSSGARGSHAGAPNAGSHAGAPNAGSSGAAPSDASLDPLAQLDLDWGVDATAGGDPASDIRALVRRYEAVGIEPGSLRGVGYRVVHGGDLFRAPTVVTAAVIDRLEELRPLAPLHNGVAVRTMRAGLAAIPGIPHVAVFDTAFHATLPPEAYRYPVPRQWYESWGVRRYGFHGMSVAWSVERAAALLGRARSDLSLIVAHLGSGCSVTAVAGGRSVATSMGLTPLEGLMMGTRSGSIDPGIMLYLLREGRATAGDLAEALDHSSGLAGVSGRTSDVRELLRLEASSDESATLALTLFVRRAAQEVAAAATCLARLDALVFTGGIGENASGIRARIVGRLGSVGVAPIAASDLREDGPLSDRGATPAVLRIQAREDLVVAREVARLAGA